MEQANFFQARAKLELRGSSPKEPMPLKDTIKPALSLSLPLIKTGIFMLKPTSSFKKADLSLGLIYCKPKIRPGPSSPSLGSFHLKAERVKKFWTHEKLLGVLLHLGPSFFRRIEIRGSNRKKSEHRKTSPKMFGSSQKLVKD